MHELIVFTNEFKLTAAERRNLLEFSIFPTHIYIPVWIACLVASDNSGTDLMLYRRIKEYANITKVVSQVALQKLQNHMWNLGSEMAPLSLFSSKVSDDEKKSIVGAMMLSVDD